MKKKEYFLQREVETEHNVHVRERHEVSIRRNMGILLFLLIGGYFLQMEVISVFLSIFLIVFAMCLYLIFNIYYLQRYHDFTDKLIRLKDK